VRAVAAGRNAGEPVLLRAIEDDDPVVQRVARNEDASDAVLMRAPMHADEGPCWRRGLRSRPVARPPRRLGGGGGGDAQNP
jgi:hypothetical protein